MTLVHSFASAADALLAISANEEDFFGQFTIDDADLNQAPVASPEVEASRDKDSRASKIIPEVADSPSPPSRSKQPETTLGSKEPLAPIYQAAPSQLATAKDQQPVHLKPAILSRLSQAVLSVSKAPGSALIQSSLILKRPADPPLACITNTPRCDKTNLHDGNSSPTDLPKETFKDASLSAKPRTAAPQKAPQKSASPEQRLPRSPSQPQVPVEAARSVVIDLPQVSSVLGALPQPPQCGAKPIIVQQEIASTEAAPVNGAEEPPLLVPEETPMPKQSVCHPISTAGLTNQSEHTSRQNPPPDSARLPDHNVEPMQGSIGAAEGPSSADILPTNAKRARLFDPESDTRSEQLLPANYLSVVKALEVVSLYIPPGPCMTREPTLMNINS